MTVAGIALVIFVLLLCVGLYLLVKEYMAYRNLYKALKIEDVNFGASRKAGVIPDTAPWISMFPARDSVLKGRTTLRGHQAALHGPLLDLDLEYPPSPFAKQEEVFEEQLWTSTGKLTSYLA